MVKMQDRATTVLRAFASRPVKSHLPKVIRNGRKAAHLPKVEEEQCDGMYGHSYLSRACCSSPPSEGAHKRRQNSSPSEGEQKQQENSPASEGARKWPETSEPYSFGRSKENAGRHDSFRRSKRRRILQNDITEAVEALRRFHSFGRSRENARKRDSFERSKKE